MKSLAIALFLSIFANGFLVWQWLDKRDEVILVNAALIESKNKSDEYAAAANACTDAVEDLMELSRTRSEEAKEKRRIAEISARKHEVRAQETLSSLPKFPDDACKSADALASDWLKKRGQ